MFKPINGWTKQAILDHIEVEFKGRSITIDDNGDEFCTYRGNKNTKCAAGMFIPDEVYSTDLEGITIDALMDKRRSLYVESVTNVMPLEASAMRALQKIHDKPSDFYGGNVKLQMIEWVKLNVKDN